MIGSDSSGTGRLPLSELRRLIDTCDRFEAELRNGQAPRLEAYLAEAQQEVDARTLFRELLLLEVEYRVRGGSEPSPGEYRGRFPEHAGLIDSVFDDAQISTLGWDASLGPLEPESTEGEGGPEATSATRAASEGPGDADVDAPASGPRRRPETIGRYRVERVLGEGGFGRVYQALDVELGRRVAIKVPHPHRVVSARDVEAYSAEARVLAGLDHPGIVPVYDVGRIDDGTCYIVSKLIDGSDLAAHLRRARPSRRDAAALVATVAEAVHHAHTRGLVHRDIKARNILIDRAGRAYLTDFGLALREEDFGKGPRFAGTPIYMSPEQARGEGHLVDGRSDIFSLGVVFYELLTGTRPFKGGTWHETIERIKTLDVRPPRQLDDTIPKELERICLKALARRVSDRYSTALDLAEDLRHALGQLGAGPAGLALATAAGVSGGADPDVSVLSLPIVPKGLRCFEAEDADFFLRLLPGPRDRDGLPESLRFWKARIEADADDAARSFRVGLVYGPSGCGKSSLVRAGLLPRLDRRIDALPVEATADDTESRLAAALRRRFPSLPAGATLPELLAAIRRGGGAPEGHKVLVVLDQFEQWLHANRAGDDSELVRALRQCDGARLQCLVIVRDDFWMSVTRFLHELEVRLVEGQNSAAVDLFDLKHARKVLTAFGRAFEALPALPGEPSREQLSFINQAVSGLAEDGKVVCVHLSLFAEMVKGKAWTPASLRDVGGTQGVGVAFLEETFAPATSPPEHRRHQRAAREVLRALLPEQGTEIRGHMRSRGALLEASGYSGTPGDFDEVLAILDNELRLITPIDRQGAGPGEVPDLEPHYQLTHDYLVPALREWLTRKQRETRRGRAALRLAERAALWAAKREAKQLPSLAEWLEIRLLCPSRRWSPREASMMHAAGRHHAAFVGCALALLGLIGLAGTEGYRRVRAGALFDQLFSAESERVPDILAQIAPDRRLVEARLLEKKARARPGSAESLRASLALLPTDPGQVGALVGELLQASPRDIRLIRDALAPGSPDVVAGLWRAMDVESPQARLRAACALASFDPHSLRWKAIAADIVTILLTKEGAHEMAYWGDLLRPVRAELVPPLRENFLTQKDSQRGYVAAALLALYTGDQPAALLELVREAGPRQLRLLMDAEDEASRSEFADRAGEILSREPPPDAAPTELDRLARQKANAALVRVASRGEATLWPLLENRADPRVRSQLIQRIPRFELDPRTLLDRLESEPTATIRQALALGLGGYDHDLLPEDTRAKLVPRLLAMYRDDTDPGVHSALDWLLRRWQFGDAVRKADLELSRRGPTADGGWWVNSELHTMAVVPGPAVFLMGSPEVEEYRVGADETQHLRRIPRTYEIATKEVTVAQFRRLMRGHEYQKENSPDEDCPINRISLYDAARYCRRLSEQEGIPDDQMCYPKVEDIVEGFRMEPDFLRRTGYRLATEAEWEAACRAGTTTPAFFGSDPDLAAHYCWMSANSGNWMHPVGETIPNPLGLFDMLGNAFERCLDPLEIYPPWDPKPVDDDDPFRGREAGRAILASDEYVLRGGAFHRNPRAMRSALRQSDKASSPNPLVGFRIARTRPVADR